MSGLSPLNITAITDELKNAQSNYLDIYKKIPVAGTATRGADDQMLDLNLQNAFKIYQEAFTAASKYLESNKAQLVNGSILSDLDQLVRKCASDMEGKSLDSNSDFSNRRGAVAFTPKKPM